MNYGCKYYIGSFCPECDCKIYFSKETIHHCLVYVNGLPTEGKNHMKPVVEIKELIGKTK